MGDRIGILGIVGMDGIWKTTFAGEIFNSYARESKFQHMSFLEIQLELFILILRIGEYGHCH